jgi:hypothetical protein
MGAMIRGTDLCSHPERDHHPERIIVRGIFRPTARRVRRLLLTTLVFSSITMLGFSQNAYADVIAENSGVRGRGDWTWNVSSLTNVYLGVRDLACGDGPVFVQLRVSTNGGTYYTTERRNSNGCGTALDWTGLSTSTGNIILGAQVRACVDGGACALSGYHDNPRT